MIVKAITETEREILYLLPEFDDHERIGLAVLSDGYWWFIPDGIPLTCKALNDVSKLLADLNS